MLSPGAICVALLNQPLLLYVLLWLLWDVVYVLKLSTLADDFSAFAAYHLIPLDKQPGVRPIGIGEVSWCIFAKAILRLVDLDIRTACGALQVCAGCEGGCEAAI